MKKVGNRKKFYISNSEYTIVVLSLLKQAGLFSISIVVGSRLLVPPDALQPKAYLTNPGL